MTMNISIFIHYPYFELPNEMNKQEIQQAMKSPIYLFKILIKRKKGGTDGQ